MKQYVNNDLTKDLPIDWVSLGEFSNMSYGVFGAETIQS